MEIYQGNTTTALVFNLVLAVDHITPATGKVPTVLLSKNGNVFAAPAGAVSEIANGAYKVDPNAVDADTIGSLLLYATAAACDPVTKEWTVVAVPAPELPPAVGDGITTNATTLIELALQSIGRVAPGESLPGELLAQGFSVLTEMMDNWKTHKLFVPFLARQTLTLEPGKTVYTVGPGGDLDIPRPYLLKSAFMQDLTAPSFERQISVFDEEAQADRPYKVLTGDYVTEVYYDRKTYPLATLYVPRDLGSGTLVLYVLTGLVQFASLGQAYLLLPGYAKAIRYNLAVQLAGFYGIQPSAFVYDEARKAIGDVKRLNQRVYVLTNYFGPAGVYNIYSDEYR